MHLVDLLGYDFYLESSKGFFVLTPRFGVDAITDFFSYGFSYSEDNSSSLSTSLELGYVFLIHLEVQIKMDGSIGTSLIYNNYNSAKTPPFSRKP